MNKIKDHRRQKSIMKPILSLIMVRIPNATVANILFVYIFIYFLDIEIYNFFYMIISYRQLLHIDKRLAIRNRYYKLKININSLV